MNKETVYAIARSWGEVDSELNSLQEIIHWVSERNQTVAVDIKKTRLQENSLWFYDQEKGCISNQNHSFFSIIGFQQRQSNGDVISQPVILQQEIGYLGIICKEIGGVMHFLMQAKIEPGNVNKIQISPTIQATKSNFMQKHGGAKPPYLEYFVNANQYEIVVDQIQSEQSSRFYKKRNRNIIIRVDDDIEVLQSHRWMTLGQIKRLMREDNLVNMDTRTVLSCIPFSKIKLTQLEFAELFDMFEDKALFRSIFVGEDNNQLPLVYHCMNNMKMFNDNQSALVPMYELKEWEWKNNEFVCTNPYSFKVIFCDIAIEGREVKRWMQPLFEACGIATFGLICCEQDGILKFLVKITPEIGCFDKAELGPTVQREAVPTREKVNVVEDFFDVQLSRGTNVVFDHLLSEEGGRFYHEQNRNILIRVQYEELPPLPEQYFLLDYRTLNELVQVNNTINIQLRNLLSLLEV